MGKNNYCNDSGFDPQYSSEVDGCFNPQYSSEVDGCFNPQYSSEVDGCFNPRYIQRIVVTNNSDYNKLHNKPILNGVTIEGEQDLVDFNLRPIFCASTDVWNNFPLIVSELGAIYIYSDYKTKLVDDMEINVPGIKVGDGNAYVIDLPFISASDIDISDAAIEEIINEVKSQVAEDITPAVIQAIKDDLISTQSLVTPEDRARWNHSVTTYINNIDAENLVFSFV